MKLNKTFMAMVMALGVVSVSNAANQGNGTVKFEGAITDAPCNIDSGSLNQTVTLDAVSAVKLKDGGKSNPTSFKITLTDCDVITAKSVTTTFNGIQSTAQPGFLALNGSARGASLSIADATGGHLDLGQASTARNVEAGLMNLHFNATLQGDGPAIEVVPGEFTATADFMLTYQ